MIRPKIHNPVYTPRFYYDGLREVRILTGKQEYLQGNGKTYRVLLLVVAAGWEKPFHVVAKVAERFFSGWCRLLE